MASQNFKIVPVEQLPLNQRIIKLHEYLAANVHVSIEDAELEKAASFQQHLDTLNELTALAKQV